ncbi:MAG TPA: hypothetical protein VF092_29815 [Longimicrobium sp.]
MHPDDAVDLALQDLRSLTHPAAVDGRIAARTPSLLRAVWRRYVDGWKWYAASELAVPEPAAAFPLRRASVPAPAATRRRAGGITFNCAHPRFELLFGGRTLAGLR